MTQFSFWITVECPVCREVIANYSYTLTEMLDDVAEAIRDHEKGCKEKHSKVKSDA